MDIKIKECENIEEFENILLSNNGSPFSSSLFLESIKDRGHQPVYYKFIFNNNIIGGISGIIDYTNNNILRKIKIIKSLTLYTGYFINNRKYTNRINYDLYKYFKKQGYLKYINHGYDNSIYMYANNTEIKAKIHTEYEINLRDNIDKIKNKYHRNFVRNIKKAEKYDLVFENSIKSEYVEYLNSLIDQTIIHRYNRGYLSFIRNPLPYMETKQIKNILKNKIAEIYYIKNNDIILSIQLVLKLKKRAIGLFIGTTLEGYEKHANSLLYNNIIETLKENNYNTYNLMGVPKQNWEGLERYKLGMGAEKVDTWSITSPFLQNKLLEYSIKIYRRMKKLTD